MNKYEVVVAYAGQATTISILEADKMTAVDRAAREYAAKRNTDTLKISVISVKEIIRVK